MRKKPYTQIGISRKKCVRCGSKAHAQWQICALNNLYTPICLDCDIALNDAVLQFMRIPKRVRIIKSYRQKLGGQ